MDVTEFSQEVLLCTLYKEKLQVHSVELTFEIKIINSRENDSC